MQHKHLMYQSHMTSRYERWIRGLSDGAQCALWLFPGSSTLDAEAVVSLAAAFDGLAGIVWHINPGNSLSARIRDYKRAFGDYPALTKDVVVSTTFEYSGREGKRYSDVAWLRSHAYEAIGSLLLNHRGVFDRTLAFIPDDEVVAQEWAHVVNGLAWLHLCYKWVYSSPNPPIDADAVLTSYIRLTQELGGVPGLVWTDHDNGKGLVFFGQRSRMGRVIDRLEGAFEHMGSPEFDDWFARGVYSPALH